MPYAYLECPVCQRKGGKLWGYKGTGAQQVEINDIQIKFWNKEMLNIRKKNFKTALRKLLEEYNASINWTCDPSSDLACVFDAHLEILDNSDIQEKPILVFNNEYIDIHEIDDNCEVIITSPKDIP